MSGPKSVNWLVDDGNQYVRSHILAELLAERQQLVQDLTLAAHALCSQANAAKQHYGEDFPDLIGEQPNWSTDAVTLEEKNALILRIRDFTEQISSRLAQTIAIHEVRGVLRNLTQNKDGYRTDSHRSNALFYHTDTKISCTERDAKITTILERVVSGGSKNSMDEIIEFAMRRVATIDERSRFETLLLELQYRIQRHNETANVVLNEAKKASCLREKLVGLTGDSTIKRLDYELEQVERQELRLRTTLPLELEAAVARARKLLDRQYAGMVIREELARLGYQIEEGFDTLFVFGGEVQLRKAELSEYHVVMTVDPSVEKLSTQVARFGDPDEEQSQQQLGRDAHMQEIWCEDLAAALSASECKGVRGRVFERVRVGVLPATVITTAISEKSRTPEDVLRSVKHPLD